jgi:hypothetical protein
VREGEFFKEREIERRVGDWRNLFFTKWKKEKKSGRGRGK